MLVPTVPLFLNLSLPALLREISELLRTSQHQFLCYLVPLDDVRAEISDSTVVSELYEIVMSHMVHGPCGSINPESSCTADGYCTKAFRR